MRRTARRIIAAGLALAVVVGLFGPGPDAGAARAEMAPPGTFISTKPHPLMVMPEGKYRTRLGWLLASRVADKARSTFERGIFFGHGTDAIYRSALSGEASYFKSLEGTAHYRYADGLTRDLAQLQILVITDGRLWTALETIPGALASDITAAVLTAGIPEILSTEHRHILDLNPRYLQPGTQENVIARYAVIDLEMRYRDLVKPSVFQKMKGSIRKSH